MAVNDWYAELRLPPDASTEQIRDAVELRSRQGAALANTAPERSQHLREQIRAIKRDLLSGDEARQRYDAARRADANPSAVGGSSIPEATPLSLTATGAITPEPAAAEPRAPVGPAPAAPWPADVRGHGYVPVLPPASQQWPMTPPGPPNMPPEVPAGGDSQPRPATWRTDKRVWIVAAVVVLLAVAGTAFALMAGGKKHPSHVAGPSGPLSSSPTQPGDTAPPSDTGGPSSPGSGTPATPQSDNPGDTVLSLDAMAAACGQSTAPTDASTDGSGVGSTWSGTVDEVLPNATVIVDCADANSQASGVAAIAARTGTVLWTRDLPGTKSAITDGNGDSQVLLSGGGKDIYLLQITDHPAEGLHDEYFTRTVTAVDATTGKNSWTQPLEKSDRTSNSATGIVTEDLSAVPGQAAAIVHVDDYSAFDVSSGKPLWERHDLSFDSSSNPFLAGYGRALDITTNNNGDEVVICIDLATGKRLWTTPVGTNTGTAANNERAELVGTDYWFFNQSGYDAYNVLSGKHSAHGVFPTSFSNVLATPRYTAAQVGTSLQLFKTGQWSTPLWTRSSDGATPHIVTSKAVLVEASAGYELLNAADGQPLQSAVTSPGDQKDLVDGLLVTDSGLIEFGLP